MNFPIKVDPFQSSFRQTTEESSDVEAQPSQSSKKSCCARIPFFCRILVILAVTGVLSAGIMYFLGSFTGIKDLFNDDWDLEDISWPNERNGLHLNLVNSLTDDWDGYFNEAVNDWNQSPSLVLSTNVIKAIVDQEERCSHIDNIMRVCNGEYGKDIGWQGVNEALFIEDPNDGKKIMISSVAIMNDSYLSKKSDAQKLYVMCHELGHGFGLPHRDEITWNKNLGSCLDYTNDYEVNRTPDKNVDFQNLETLYGVFQNKNRTLVRDRQKKRGVFESKYSKVAQKTTWNYQEGRLLLSLPSKDVYENDLGNGVKVLTTFLKAD